MKKIDSAVFLFFGIDQLRLPTAFRKANIPYFDKFFNQTVIGYLPVMVATRPIC